MTAGNHSPWRWLASTKQLQEEAFGVDFGQLTGEKLADYVLTNAYSVNDEIAEVMGEFNWKPWAKNRGEFTDRDAFVGELVDAAHFLANLACAADVTDEEWERLYQAKQGRNRARQKHGYDAVKSKCPACKRELDKPGVVEIAADAEEPRSGVLWLNCRYCDEHLGMITADGVLLWAGALSVPGVTAESLACTCHAKGIGRPPLDPDCLFHRRPRNHLGIPM